MESKLLTVNKKLQKFFKNIRRNALSKFVSFNVKLHLLNGFGKSRSNIFKKYLLYDRNSLARGDAKSLTVPYDLFHWLKIPNRNEPSVITRFDFWRYLSVLAESKSGGHADPDVFRRAYKSKRKGKAVWSRSAIDDGVPLLSRGYKDDKSEGRKNRGQRTKNQDGDVKVKKMLDSVDGGEPGLPLPPPRLKCRLSCPLPPPEFAPPAPKDFSPSFRPSGVRFSVLPDDLLSSEKADRNKSGHEFSFSRRRQKKSSTNAFDWTPGKSRKIYPFNFGRSVASPFDEAQQESVPKMRALVFAPGTLKLEYHAVDAPSKIHKDEVLVQISYSGVCGTDLFIKEGKMSCRPGPLILGHEISGKVYAAGSDVQEVKPGENVVINPYSACCTCKYCTIGVYSCCLKEGPDNSIGIAKDGGWTEYIVVKKTQIHKVPGDLGLDQAALIHPLSCILSAYYKLNVSPGTTVLIQGLGLTGCLWASVFHVHGHRSVFVNDKSPRKKKQFLALSLGYDFMEIDEMGKVGADVIIECTGSAASIEKSLKVLNPHGQMCLFGKPNPTTEIRCMPYDIVKNEIRLLGSHGNAFCFSKAIELALTMSYRYLDFHKLGVKVFDLQDFREAFQLKKSGEVSKIMFKMNP